MSIILVLVLVAIATLFLVQKRGSGSSIQNINAQGLKDLLEQSKPQLVDVRTPQEYKGHHAKGFVNVPLQNLAQKLDDFDKSRPIVVICASGARSAQAAKILTSAGFEQVYNFSGGMASYRQ